MTTTEVQDVARRLMAAKGDQGQTEARRLSAECSMTGREKEADDWRRVADAIFLLRGPRAG